LELIEKHGEKWSFISEIMIGKSPNSIKNRWYRHLMKNGENNLLRKISSKTASRTAKLVLFNGNEIHKETPIIIKDKTRSKIDDLFESDFDLDNINFDVNTNY
jgi:hypothetical protein